LVSKLVREHCTVAIGGDGGDELFGGYKHYNRMLSSNNLYSHLPLFLRRSVSQISESILPIGFKGKHWFQSMAYDLNSGLPITSSYFDQKYRNKLIKSNTNWSFEAEGIRKSRIIKIETYCKELPELTLRIIYQKTFL